MNLTITAGSRSICNTKNEYNLESLRHLNILLAEDNPLYARLVSILFSQIGLTLVVVENGIACIEKLKSHHFDIVLMDIEMPGMSGFEATHIIRHELKCNVPIIAMTASAIPGERENYLSCGMNAHITKPANKDILFKIIYNLAGGGSHSKVKVITPLLTTPVAFAEKNCNLSYLVTATRGNLRSINSIITVFLKQTPEELSFLNEAIKKMKYKIISDISHKLKSSFSILGISVLEPVFEEMERLGNISSGIEKIELLKCRINNVFGQVVEEMKIHLSGKHLIEG